ncbi:MazG nucleotide pyrophosphohydrolase domain-containing protein [Solimonas marina]|uniref:MazG family protein n=1 Tax=Solimonas marina TaxID=2714601 RepID=A0A970B9Q1_9GAMM|nr:MazG nucleotide pyrophosphohydrolase domain-containing protein [Solimonas marina]NKF22596.1 MazG family protein [Solimonas marina]
MSDSEQPLAGAHRLQREAAALGFDWRETAELWGKLAEEIGELQAAVSEGPARIEDELGDLLFMAVNLARHLGVDASAALAGANAKFARRFAHVCAELERLPPIGDPRRIVEMEARWQDAKRAEKSR